MTNVLTAAIFLQKLWQRLGQLLVVAQTDSCLGRGLRQGLRLVRGVVGAAVADGGLAGEAPGFGQVTTATHRRGLSPRVRKTDQYSHTPRGGLLCHTHFHVSVKLPYLVQDVGTVHVCEATQDLVHDDLYVVVDLQLLLFATKQPVTVARLPALTTWLDLSVGSLLTNVLTAAIFLQISSNLNSLVQTY